MNGGLSKCPLCGSDKIGHSAFKEFVLNQCITCNCEWKEKFEKVYIDPKGEKNEQ